MRLYKCKNQTVDLDHVLAVSDLGDSNGFAITLALRNEPLYITMNWPHSMGDLLGYKEGLEEIIEIREDLLKAWEKE